MVAKQLVGLSKTNWGLLFVKNNFAGLAEESYE